MGTQTEKRLFLVLALVVFVGGNFYGYRWLAQKQQALQLSRAELKADQAEAEVDLQKQSWWAERKNWIDKNEPSLQGDEGDAKAQVSQAVAKGARDHQLEVMEQNLNDTQHGPAGTRVNVELKVKGSMQSLCQWLADLEKPASFYAVSQLSLKVDQDQKSFICTLQMERYFKEGS